MIVRQYRRLSCCCCNCSIIGGGRCGANCCNHIGTTSSRGLRIGHNSTTYLHRQRLDCWWIQWITNRISSLKYFIMMIVMIAGINYTKKQMMGRTSLIDRIIYNQSWKRTYHSHQNYHSLSSINPSNAIFDNFSLVTTVTAATFQYTGRRRNNRWYRPLQQHRRLSSELFSSSSSSSDDATNSNRNSRYITYLTDVEGDRDYLQRYVEQSRVLCWKEFHQNEVPSLPPPTPLIDRPFPFPYTHYIDFQRCNVTTSSTSDAQPNGYRQRTDDIVVFGGDIWDQGGSDLYVIRQLLDLKLRYPENVFFVMGNRDINKMRIVEEIGPANTTNENLPTHYGCYWFENSGRIGDPKLGLLPYNTAVDRLKWMLNYTMGSPRAFEYRRWELQHLCNNSTIITDEDVVESYRQSCDPQTGEMSHFLRNASLFLRIGDVAFLHGAFPFTSENLLSFIKNKDSSGSLWDDLSFAMPWLKQGDTARDVNVHDTNDWIDALNAFAKESVENWVSSNGQSEEIWSLRGGYHPTSLYGQLLQYGMGRIGGTKRGWNPTIVYSRWGIPGTPRKFFRCDPTCEQDKAYVHNTKDFFRRTGIRLICTGHQPAGEMPCHIRIDDPDYNTTSWILSGDTSYTGDTVWLNLPGDTNPPIYNFGRGQIKSGRGPYAVSEVLIEQCITTGTILNVHSHGTFSDGSQYQSQSLDFGSQMSNNQTNHSDDDALMVGTLASGKYVPSTKDSPHGGQWWTQAALDDGSILLAAGSGFNYWTRKVNKK